jgi:hypothetical protein
MALWQLTHITCFDCLKWGNVLQRYLQYSFQVAAIHILQGFQRRGRGFCHTCLATALKSLPANMFFKTHRAYAASILYIDNISRDHLTMGGEVIPIGRQFYNGVIAKIHIIE